MRTSSCATRSLSLLAIVLLASTFTCLPAWGAPSPKAEDKPKGTWVLAVSEGSGEVTMDAIGKPSMLKIHGKGEAPKGELTVAGGKLNGALTFKLETLDTGIKKRNGHMKEKYLEVGKYPEAKMTFTDFPLPANVLDEKFTADALPFKANLSIHGVEKPIEGKAKVSRQGENLAVDAGFEIKTSDFAISTPSFAGVTMAENVKVQSKITAPFHEK